MAAAGDAAEELREGVESLAITPAGQAEGGEAGCSITSER